MEPAIIDRMKQTATSQIELFRGKTASGCWLFCLSPTSGGEVAFSNSQIPRLIKMLQRAYRDTSAIIARENQ